MKGKKVWWLIIGLLLLLVIAVVIAKHSGDDGTKVAVEKAGPHTIT